MTTTTDSQSRRRFLKGVAAAAAAASTKHLAAEPARRGEEALEEALARLAATGPEYGGGLANHGPMAVEALAEMGRPEAIGPWVDRYRRRLDSHPGTRAALRGDDWREALGRGERVGDFIALFDRELAEGPWTQVLRNWVPRLAPGLVAAATHGVIRTGHAVRALGQRDTPVRRHELAEGLAYWAARYVRLPERPGSATAGERPSRALAGVALLPPERRASGGLIMVALSRLEGFTPFETVAGRVDVSGDASAFLSDLTGAFAQVYLDQTHDAGGVIGFIHAVTGPSAVRLLLPALDDASRPVLLRYAWQAAAGLYVAFGRPAPAVPLEKPPGADALVERAVATGDEHAIKFAEACLREHALSPQPVYLAAAWNAAARLG